MSQTTPLSLKCAPLRPMKQGFFTPCRPRRTLSGPPPQTSAAFAVGRGGRSGWSFFRRGDCRPRSHRLRAQRRGIPAHLVAQGSGGFEHPGIQGGAGPGGVPAAPGYPEGLLLHAPYFTTLPTFFLAFSSKVILAYRNQSERSRQNKQGAGISSEISPLLFV